MRKIINPTSKSVDLNIHIPDREPYEAKATQKQKSWLFHHGFDTKDIDKMGRNQASSAIEQTTMLLSQARHNQPKRILHPYLIHEYKA